MNARRNRVRAVAGGIVCHWGWGGKLADEQRPGGHVGDAQPTDLDAALEPLLLDGVDLPEVVGGVDLGAGDSRAMGSSGAVDARPLEGPLQDTHRRDRRRVVGVEQLDADPPGPPGGVGLLEPTGDFEESVGIPGRHAAAGPITDDEARLTAMAKRTPEVSDGRRGELEIDGDAGQGLAVTMASDDLLADGEGDGAWHGGGSRVDRRSVSRYFIHAGASGVKLHVASGG